MTILVTENFAHSTCSSRFGGVVAQHGMIKGAAGGIPKCPDNKQKYAIGKPNPKRGLG